MDYLLLKSIHITAVALSLVGFLARGLGMLIGAQWVRSRTAKTAPHVIDTLLLLSAVGMLVMLHLNPLTVPWLAAKLAGLLVYIALGSVALRPSSASMPTRAASGFAALLVFGWIVSVAITKQPLGVFSLD